ncbi:MAG: FAD-binding domain-containing protein [Kineosporiaceae bacterium]
MSVSSPTLLPVPQPGPAAAIAWVRRHLGDLCLEGPDGVTSSPGFRGGQSAADARLAALDVTGYARRRNEVHPPQRRGATRLSPYVRHGLLDLPTVWRHVADAPRADRERYRDELLWQEYARHLYARLGPVIARPLRHPPPVSPPLAVPGPTDPPPAAPPPTDPPPAAPAPTDPWPREMACMDLAVGELERDGWLVNQTRMWLASQWTVRAGHDWREGEDRFFRHLLDGSRAANRLGWQWTVGTGTGRPYGFSRWQVRRRAPGLCDTCRLRDCCPVEAWPDEAGGVAPPVDPPPGLRGDPDPVTTAGPAAVDLDGEAPGCVWLTFESLGDADPALAAHPGLPVVAVFDEELLARLRLSGKRLVFLAETLADLATRRDLEVHRGDPVEVLAGRRAAVTHAPVPGFRTRARRIRPAAVHPWPWLVPPHAGPVTSFTAWRRAAGV